MAEKIQGSVKWFSNKKGYGFITPVEGSSVANDIFVHQSAIHSEGYRTLDEEWLVEFEVGHDEDGKPKAENVTAPGGGPCTGPRKPRATNSRRRRNHASQDTNGDAGMDGDEMGVETTTFHGEDGAGDAGKVSAPPRKKEPQPLWHDALAEGVKQAFSAKSIRTSTGTIDISFGNARIKLGTRSYASIATDDGVLAEGSFNCDVDGNADFEWRRAVRFTDIWNPVLDVSGLISEINLTDDSVQAVGVDETMNTLMGEHVSDPKTTLIASGFEMRRVVLTTKRR